MFEDLEKELKSSLLERNEFKVEILKLIKSFLLLEARAKNLSQPSDEMCLHQIEKQIKNCEEILTLNNLSAKNRQQAEAEIEILRSLLPAQLNQDELASLVDEVIKESGIPLNSANFKSLLDAVSLRAGHQASRSRIAQILQTQIKQA